MNSGQITTKNMATGNRNAARSTFRGSRDVVERSSESCRNGGSKCLGEWNEHRQHAGLRHEEIYLR